MSEQVNVRKIPQGPTTRCCQMLPTSPFINTLQCTETFSTIPVGNSGFITVPLPVLQDYRPLSMTSGRAEKMPTRPTFILANNPSPDSVSQRFLFENGNGFDF